MEPICFCIDGQVAWFLAGVIFCLMALVGLALLSQRKR
jgi:hypothetical protein